MHPWAHSSIGRINATSLGAALDKESFCNKPRPRDVVSARRGPLMALHGLRVLPFAAVLALDFVAFFALPAFMDFMAFMAFMPFVTWPGGGA